MKPSSSPCEPGPFAPLLSTPDADRLCGAEGWLSAMLTSEAALAKAQADCGLIPGEAAAAIAAACEAGFGDTVDVFAEGASTATPVVPLVRALTAAVPASARGWVHYGATSQDILDTAMMLIAREVCSGVRRALDDCAIAAARLADGHAQTVQIGRTLGQQAAPTTFGLVAAGWLTAIDVARRELHSAGGSLAAQLGGPVGTLETFGPQSIRLMARYAREVGLARADLPWHTDRTRVTGLASALTTVTGALAKPARDVAILSAAEYGELSEGDGGGSSAMPHKRNPVSSVAILANARRAPGLAAPLWSGLEAELQRPAGAWQAEWPSVSGLLRAAAGTAHHGHLLLQRLRVNEQRMRDNLEATGGLHATAAVAALLADPLGRDTAHEIVQRHARQSRRGEFRANLTADPQVSDAVDSASLEAAFDTETLRATSRQLIDHALKLHRARG